MKFPLFKKKDEWERNVQELSSVCSRLGGTFVPDEDDQVVACVVSDRGLNISYFRKGYYLIALTGDGMIMSTVSKELPEFSILPGGFSVVVEKPEVVKAHTVSDVGQ